MLPLPHSLRSKKARCSSDAEFSLRSLEECRIDLAGKERGEISLADVPGEGAMRVWLRTGDHGDDTADGAGNRRRPAC